MNYKDWEPFYKKIIKEFNFDYKKDKKSAEILNNLLVNKKSCIINLKKLIENKEVIIFGSGPSLELTYDKNLEFIKEKTKITADGATSLLLKKDCYPDIIVTDLDGKIDDQIESNSKGSICIVHAHGDNIENLNKFVKKFKGCLIGSTQINPSKYEKLINFGGFTDGDRAVFLAEQYNAKKIYLIGFDFNSEIGKYSYPEKKNIKQKIEKLKWSKKFIDLLENKYNNIIYLKKIPRKINK